MMTRRPRRLRDWLALATALLGACSTRAWVEDADAEVDEIIPARTEEVLGGRQETVKRPLPEKEEPALPQGGGGGLEPIRVDLAKALEIAVESNRDYLSRKESLYLSGLSYGLTRFNFGPQLNSTMNYVYSDSEGATGNHSSGAGFSVSQILPTGGSLSFTSSASLGWPEGGSGFGNSNSASVGVSLSQPLLRGAGYEVSHEALTQAERSLVYAIRDFELFREDFSIGIAETYFNLVAQKETLANQSKRYDDALFDRDKALALRSVDRNADKDVFSAQRQEIVAHNDLIAAEAAYQRSVDEFKIRLGLATSVPIEIVEEKPPFDAVRLDRQSAIDCARVNRLDIQTQEDRLEDSARSLRIAENTILPNLSMDVSYGLGGAGGTLSRALPDDYSYTAGLSLTIPLQRKAERNAYVSTLISHRQAKRSFEETIDRLDLDISAQLRDLRSVEERIQLQQDQIQQSEQAVAVTQIRYEGGDADNRDLLDARQSLTDAKNQLIQLNVQHFIGRLRLLRNLGLLFIDDKGKWI